VIVNESLAHKHWQRRSPIGECARILSADCAVVVGVAADAAFWPSLRFVGREFPAFFVPIEQETSGGERTVVLRTRGPSSPLVSLVRSEAQAAGGTLPFIDVTAVDDLFQPALQPLRVGSAVFSAFGLLALFIASVGLAVITGYAVTRRHRELGIRMALGADPQRLVRDVLRRSLVAACSGIVFGVALAWAGSRSLRALLFEVAPDDPRIYVGVAATFLVVAVIAALLPARRVLRIDPAEALRTE
jgi:hypothetical protein